MNLLTEMINNGFDEFYSKCIYRVQRMKIPF